MTIDNWMRNLPGVSAHDWQSEVRMRYLRAGSGRPLLLIHGFLGYSFSWRFNLLPLSKIATVYAPDLPGLGYSQRDGDIDTDLEVRANHMLRFMEAMRMRHADVLGTSLGGALAVLLTSLCEKKSPGRVRRLILVDPVNPWSSHGKGLTRVAATTLGGLAFRAAFPGIKLMQRTFIKRMYGDPRRISPGTLEGYTEPLKDPRTLTFILSSARSWHSNLEKVERGYESLADFPTQLIWGDRDTAVFPTSAHEVQRRMHRSELVMMKGVGHLPYEEVPEEFNEIVMHFLSRD